jgi:hypothetical protein
MEKQMKYIVVFIAVLFCLAPLTAGATYELAGTSVWNDVPQIFMFDETYTKNLLETWWNTVPQAIKNIYLETQETYCPGGIVAPWMAMQLLGFTEGESVIFAGITDQEQVWVKSFHFDEDTLTPCWTLSIFKEIQDPSPVSAVPESSTFALFSFGLVVGIAALGRKLRPKSCPR